MAIGGEAVAPDPEDFEVIADGRAIGCIYRDIDAGGATTWRWSLQDRAAHGKRAVVGRGQGGIQGRVGAAG